MTAHELAERLRHLPDLRVVFVLPEGQSTYVEQALVDRECLGENGAEEPLGQSYVCLSGPPPRPATAEALHC